MPEEKELTVPEWVINHFREPFLTENPTLGVGFPDRDSLTLSYAQREAILASQNLSFLTDPKQVIEEKRRLAENLLILGEFNKAEDIAESEPDSILEEILVRIRSYRMAVEEMDDKFCGCPDDQTQLQKTNHTISRFKVLQRIYSPKHNRMIDVKQCRKCLFVNATDLQTRGETEMTKALGEARLKKDRSY